MTGGFVVYTNYNMILQFAAVEIACTQKSRGSWTPDVNDNLDEVNNA